MTSTALYSSLNVTFNDTNNATTPGPSMEGGADSTIVPIIFALICVVGVVGNGLVVYILFRYGERSVTNVYIINLALADLAFVVIALPITSTTFAIPYWIFGDGMCKIFNYTIYVSIRFQVMLYNIHITTV